MSFTIVTDVFCDFCPQWMSEGGISCIKPQKNLAWKKAKHFGWSKQDEKHRCPNCTYKSLLKNQNSLRKRTK